MNASSRVLTACLLLGTLSACGSGTEDPPQGEERSAPEDTVFDPMLDQRDYVKQQAENLPQERKARLDEAIGTDSQ